MVFAELSTAPAYPNRIDLGFNIDAQSLNPKSRARVYAASKRDKLWEASQVVFLAVHGNDRRRVFGFMV